MNKFAVNLSTVFTEVPFLERFKKAQDCGFSYVECQFPYAYSVEEIKRELEEHQVSMVLINLPPGNWEKGDRGIAMDPKRMEEFKGSVNEGIQYATALKVPRVHCMAGNLPGGDREVYIKNLRFAAEAMKKYGLTLLIEPINPFDMPNYYLSNLYQAAEILEVVDRENVKLQFDFYHIERVHGNSLTLFKEFAGLIGHVQIADVPGRHEPGTGRMDYKAVFQYLADTYDGFIGLEYTPNGKSDESFGWLSRKGEGGK